MRFVMAAAAALGLAAPAFAQSRPTVGECDWLNNMLAVVEPWEDNARTFYQGQVRAVFVDSVEPACCWAHLLILMPDPEDEWGLRKCVAVNLGGTTGFSGLDFSRLEASYDPARGLAISFPYALYEPESGASGPWQQGEALINLSTGVVTAR